jgi:hypothetical protein
MILPRNFQISIHEFLPTMMPLTCSCNDPLLGGPLQVITAPIVKLMIISGRPESYLATGFCTGHGGRLDLGLRRRGSLLPETSARANHQHVTSPGLTITN